MLVRLLFSAYGMHAHRSPRIHCDGVELAGSADTDTLVFFAMHFPRNASLDPTDVALLQWYSREVHRANAAMYVLLYHQPIPGGPDVPHKRMHADALRRGTNELWHPVKDRSCLPAVVSGL